MACFADGSIELAEGPPPEVKAEDSSAEHQAVHDHSTHLSDEQWPEQPDFTPVAPYPDDDTDSLEGVVKHEGKDPAGIGQSQSAQGQSTLPIGKGSGTAGDGHNFCVKRQKSSSVGSWHDLPPPRSDQQTLGGEQAGEVVDLDDLDDADDDEPIIVKVESASEKEERAAQAFGRLQKEQLQANFDKAAHRKEQVGTSICCCYKL